MSEEKKIIVSLSNVSLNIELSKAQFDQFCSLNSGNVIMPRGPRTESLQHKIREELKKYISDKRAGFVLRGAKAAFLMQEKNPELREESVSGATSAALKTLVDQGYLTKQNKVTYVVTGKEETLI